MATSSRYRSFTAKEKLRIIEDAENIGNRAAGRKYDVSESCIRDWRKNKTRLAETNSNRRAFRGQKAKHPELEKRLCDYMDDKRQYGCTVTSEMCQLKALAISKELGITGFKASRCWLTRFFNRNGLGFWRKTTIGQRLPGDYEEKVVNFHSYVINLRRGHSYLLSQIGNAAQTPVYFEMPLDNTVNRKGESSVMIRTGGIEKQ